MNEAYVRLIDTRSVPWQNRKHFLAIAARQMRRQSARALQVSVDTVMRDWKMAKAWLLRELRQPAAGRETR